MNKRVVAIGAVMILALVCPGWAQDPVSTSSASVSSDATANLEGYFQNLKTERDALNKEIEDLKSEQRGLVEEIKKRMEVSHQESERARMVIADKERQVFDLKNQKTVLTDQVQDLTIQNDQIVERVDIQVRSAEESRGEVERLDIRYSEAERVLDQSARRIKDLQAENEAIKKQLASLEEMRRFAVLGSDDQLRKLSLERDNFMNELKHTSRRMTEAQEKAQKAEIEREQIKRVYEDQLQSAQEEGRRLKARLADLERDRDALSIRYDGVTPKVVSLEQKLARMDTERASLENQLALSREHIVYVEERLRRNEEQSRADKKTADFATERLRSMEDRMGLLERQNRELTRERDAVQAQIVETEKKYPATRRDVDRLNEEIRKVKDQRDMSARQYTGALSALKRNLAVGESKLKAAEDELRLIRQKMQESQEQLVASRTKAAAADDSQKELLLSRERALSLERDLAVVKSEREQLAERLKDGEGALAKQQAVIEAAEREKERLRQERQSLAETTQAQISGLQAQNGELKNQLFEKSSDLERLRLDAEKSFASFESSRQSLEMKIQSLESQIQEKSQAMERLSLSTRQQDQSMIDKLLVVRKEVEDLQSQLQQKNQEIVSIKTQAQVEKDRLESKLRAMELEMVKRQLELENLTRSKQENDQSSSEKIASLARENDSLKQLIQEKTQSLEELKSGHSRTVEDYQQQAAHLGRKLESTQADYEKLIKDKLADDQVSLEKIMALTKEMAALKSSLAEKTQVIEQLKASETDKIAGYEQQLIALRRQWEDKQADYEKLVLDKLSADQVALKKIAELTQHVAGLQTDLEGRVREIELLKKSDADKVAAYEEMILSLKTEMSLRQTEYDQLKKDKQNSDQVSVQKEQELESQVKALTEQLDEKMLLLAQTNKDSAQAEQVYRDAIKSSTDKISRLEQDLRMQQEENARLTQQKLQDDQKNAQTIEVLNEKITVFDGETTAKVNEIALLRQELEKTKDEMARDVSRLKSELDVSTKKAEKLQSKVTNLAVGVMSSDRRVQNMRKEKEGLIDRIDGLNKQISELNAVTSRNLLLEKENKLMKGGMDGLIRRADEAEMKYRELAAQYGKNQTEWMALKKKMQEDTELVTQADQFRAQNLSAMQALKATEEKLRKLMDSFVKLQEENETLKEKAEGHASPKELSQVTKRRDDLEKENQELKGRIAKMEEQLRAKEDVNYEVSRQRDQASQKIRRMDTHLESWEKDKEQWSQQEQKFQNELQERGQKIVGLSEELRKAMAENERLQSRSEAFPKDIAVVNEKVDKLQEENALLHYNLGVIYTEREMYAEAVKEFEKTLSIRPADSFAHYNLGIIYSQYVIDESKAVFHFKEYLKKAPDDQDADQARRYIVVRESYETVPLKK